MASSHPLPDPIRLDQSFSVIPRPIPVVTGTTDHYENLIRENSLGPHTTRTEYAEYTPSSAVVLADITHSVVSSRDIKAYVRAGPRNQIVYRAEKVCAAIVTCGGLCPGLNNIIRDLVMTLWYNYGVKDIRGVRNGYRGFYDETVAHVPLTPKNVSRIHEHGGTILGSSRGGSDIPKIVKAIHEKGINQVYIIGGDGSQRGAAKIAQLVKELGYPIGVCGVPKTIDNDIGVIDRSFGFDTAVEEAKKAIQCAKIEAQCCPGGIGIVKLMGREAGFISAHATLASRNVDLCLIPEVKFEMEGKSGILRHLHSHIQKHGHAVIVVAEGAGQDLVTESSETDASGNKVLFGIGEWLKTQIGNYFKTVEMEVNVKYISPSYMIRSVPANAADSHLCMVLAQQAVHGVMAGYTEFTVGLVNTRTVYIPIEDVVSKPRRMRPEGHTWNRVITTTLQPDTAQFNHMAPSPIPAPRRLTGDRVADNFSPLPAPHT